MLERVIAERDQAELRLATQQATIRVLAEAETLRDAIPGVLQAICDGLGWELGAVWTVDEEADVLRCEHTWHVPSAALDDFAATHGQKA